MVLKKVSFGTARIQKLRRVALDQNLLDTLGLGIGDVVRVELDTENGVVLISRAPDAALPQDEVSTTSRSARAKGK